MKSVSMGSVFLFLISLLVALILEVAPLTEALHGWRPFWLALTLAYWALETSRGGSAGCVFGYRGVCDIEG